MFSHTCPIFLNNYIILMTKITYVTHDNQIHTVEVQNGLTVMEGAVQNDIPGIDADCGGGMACATCHVYVNDEWFDKLPTTKKPAILVLIDKLFINNLIHNNSEDEDEDIEDDEKDSGLFGFYQEETDANSSRLKKKNIVEPPKLTRSKLFDGLDYSEDNDLDLKKNETVIVDIKSGEKM